MATKKIWKKYIKDKIYWLYYFPGDEKFVLYVHNKQVLQNSIANITEICDFETEKDANNFFKNEIFSK